MSLDNQCERCQGYFRNFTQTVRREGKCFCVQCDQAVKTGAPEAMYPEKLPSHSIIDRAAAQAAGLPGAILVTPLVPELRSN